MLAGQAVRAEVFLGVNSEKKADHEPLLVLTAFSRVHMIDRFPLSRMSSEEELRPAWRNFLLSFFCDEFQRFVPWLVSRTKSFEFAWKPMIT